MNDKDLVPILAELKLYFDKIFFTTINYERAFKIEELEEAGKELNINYERMAEPEKFLTQFISLQKDECLVILGSIYLLGEIKSHLSDKKDLTF